MSGKRGSISASMRWSILARDGFACRYCGATAGEPGVELVLDHVLSVNDGGTESHDNLITACKRCNGGKGARSLNDVPVPGMVVERVNDRVVRTEQLADSLRRLRESRTVLRQEVINLKLDAYGLEQVHMDDQEIEIAIRFVERFGPEAVSGWYHGAASRDVSIYQTVKYICGCARNTREQAAEGQGGPQK